ncbi:hypothetical protein ACFWP3_21290 [Streptomyces sp. NPDC058525]|uniref:hypothetical protein n=1 Tax=unclassified Streptomyces TaxID=2593676 RepID=UPI00366529D1
MPGHPVHPVQPAQPTQSVHHYADTTPPYAPSRPSALHSSVHPAGRRQDDPAGDVVRWAAFSCLLVPVVLVVYGTSFGGAAVATLGLVAVTAACRALLRHSERAERAERAMARVPAQERLPSAARGRHSRGSAGGHRVCGGSGPRAAPSPQD